MLLSITPLSKGDTTHYALAMLERMYLRWANHQGYEVKYIVGEKSNGEGFVFPDNDDGLGGKTYSKLEIDCPSALLATEHGIHKVTLVSPSDSQGRVHSVWIDVRTIAEEDDPPISQHIRTYDLIRKQKAIDHQLNIEADVHDTLNGNLNLFQRMICD